MAEQPFSTREIRQLFKAADERADEFHSKLTERMETFEEDVRNSLQRIEIQTSKTNGRVDKLEKWQSYVLGFCACISIFIIPIVFLAVTRFLGL